MIEVVSYLRTPDGQFVQVDDAVEAPVDPQYIEGAIEMSIDGIPILDKVMWDYVDQLWAYIADMVLALTQRGESSTYFPDQPIKLAFQKQGKSRVLVTLRINDETRTASIDSAELIKALREHGSAFFHKLSQLLPGNSVGYADALRRLTEPGSTDVISGL